MAEHLPEIKFLLGNNAARNPYFRVHPKVLDNKALSSELFHSVAMDIFPDQYLDLPICIIRIRRASNSLILPDFSLTHMILCPDIVIMRVRENLEAAEFLKMAQDDERHLVVRLNQYLTRILVRG